MLTSNDLQLLAEKKITETGLQEQLDRFVQGFPFLEIKASASVAKGIRAISDEERLKYIDCWKTYLAQNKKILKFVPASGAASRMFKDLFSFLSASYEVPTTPLRKSFRGDRTICLLSITRYLLPTKRRARYSIAAGCGSIQGDRQQSARRKRTELRSTAERLAAISYVCRRCADGA